MGITARAKQPVVVLAANGDKPVAVPPANYARQREGAADVQATDEHAGEAEERRHPRVGREPRGRDRSSRRAAAGSRGLILLPPQQRIK